MGINIDNSLIFNTLDSYDLAEKISLFIENFNLLNYYSNKSIQFSLKYNISESAVSLSKLYINSQ
jgi:hypothetical protein